MKLNLLPAERTPKNTKKNLSAEDRTPAKKRSKFLEQIITLLKREDVV